MLISLNGCTNFALLMQPNTQVEEADSLMWFQRYPFPDKALGNAGLVASNPPLD